FLWDRFVPFPIQFHLASFPAAERHRVLDEMLGRGQVTAEDLAGYLPQVFGRRLTELFFAPFQEKYYRQPLTSIAARMDRGSIPVPDRQSVLAGAAGKRFPAAGYNSEFFFPAGGQRRFIERLAAPLQDRIRYGEEVREIDLQRRRAITGRGEVPFDTLVSTMPLRDLVSRLRAPFPLPPASDLRSISTLVVNVELTRRRRRFDWVYLPQAEIPFFRVGYYPGQLPPTVYLEMTPVPGEEWPAKRIAKVVTRTLATLGMIERSAEIACWDARRVPVSYVLFDAGWQATVPPLLAQLKRHGVYSIGRYGSWNYTSMADDIASARRTAGEIAQR
ncbi:MAG TPA: hypothetical protein PKK12_15605, partial [Candidatus Aminicenantes bacterium]|nr:hypothetical protein [Candidatus Aminicenantes bacterium]